MLGRNPWLLMGNQCVYGLICVCIQTYNVRIYAVNDRTSQTVFLVLTTLVAEFGSPEVLCCDKESAFVKLNKFEKHSWKTTKDLLF